MASHLPDDFKCPISLEIMSDPVILSSGHTFDRASVQRWFDAGHRTCPISKLPLSDPPSLIPNHALRSLISSYTLVAFPKPDALPLNPVALFPLLRSPASSSEEKFLLLERLNQVCKSDWAVRRKLANSGFVSAILNCVDSGESTLQEKALHVLLNLSLDDDSKVGMVAEGVVGNVVDALRDGLGDSRAVAATLLTSLAVLEVNNVTIGSYPGTIPGLVSLLHQGNLREKKEAATALFTLCSFPDNRVRVIQNRGVPVLIQNANSGLERAVEVLGLLSKCRAARDEMLMFSGLLDILIDILKNGSSRGVQYALLALSSLCSYSENMCSDALNEGLLEICDGFLEDDNEKLRRNAQALIQVLLGRRKNA